MKGNRARVRGKLAGVLFLALLCPMVLSMAQTPAPQQQSSSVAEKSSPMGSVPEKGEQEIDENAEYKHAAPVAKLGSLLGLDAEHAALVFQFLNFLILAAGVGYLMWKLLPKQFRSRNTHIQRQLVEARTATEEAKARLSAVETRLGKLDDEIAAMRSHVEADMARDAQRLRAAAEEETQKILASADAEIQAATAAARRDLQRHAAELAIEHAARQVNVTPENDRQLVQAFAKQLVNERGGKN